MQSPRKPSRAAASASADDGGDDSGNDAAGPIRRNVSFAGADADADADGGVGVGEPEATTPTHSRPGLSRQLTFKEKRSIMEQVTPVIEAIEKRLMRQLTQTANEQRKLESESKLGISQLQATARAAQPPPVLAPHTNTHAHARTHAASPGAPHGRAHRRRSLRPAALCDWNGVLSAPAGAVAVGHT